MTKVVWLPNETDYSYCEIVAPNTPYFVGMLHRFAKAACLRDLVDSILEDIQKLTQYSWT